MVRQALAPEWDKLASAVSPSIRVGAVDADKYKDLAVSYEKEFPPLPRNFPLSSLLLSLSFSSLFSLLSSLSLSLSLSTYLPTYLSTYLPTYLPTVTYPHSPSCFPAPTTPTPLLPFILRTHQRLSPVIEK